MNWLSQVIGFAFSSSDGAKIANASNDVEEINTDNITSVTTQNSESQSPIYDSQEEHHEAAVVDQPSNNTNQIITDIQRAELLIQSLWKTYDEFLNTTQDNSQLLPQSVLYHSPSGLHNEGNWHNCIMGIAYVKLFQATQNTVYKERALKLCDSLFNLNFDSEGKLFNQRSHTTYWNHTTGNELYDKYVAESKLKKLAGNAMAIICWSFVKNESEEQSKQFHLMTENFLYHFWSQQHKKWKPEVSNTKYFRGVDQAIAILACLRMMKSCSVDDVQNTRDHKHYLSEIISATRKSLFRDFKLGKVDHKSYLGKSDTTVPWHDLWMLYSLLLSSSTPSDLKKAKQVYEAFVATHFRNGYVTANSKDSENPLCYSNDNFLFYGLLKCMRYFFPDVQLPEEFNLENNFSTFLDANKNLFVESNQHHFVALHPQTECLFGLLVEPFDYIMEDTIPKMTKHFLRPKGRKRKADSEDSGTSDMELYSSNNNSASETESSNELTNNPRRRVTKKVKILDNNE